MKRGIDFWVDDIRGDVAILMINNFIYNCHTDDLELVLAILTAADRGPAEARLLQYNIYRGLPTTGIPGPAWTPPYTPVCPPDKRATYPE